MKKIFSHPEEAKTGRRYWRSVNELENREAFLKANGREFPLGDELSEEERETSRRTFLQLMGASASLMGLASCRRPVKNILPYTKSVEWLVPGKPLLYATNMPRPYGATPLVVTTHEGRPTHLTGNALHPSVGGGIDSFAQASILGLYDPNRIQNVTRSGKAKRGREDSSWAELNAFIAKARHAWKEDGGEGTAFLVGAENSPTTSRLRAEVLKALPKAKFYQYEAINRDAQQAVNKALLGEGVTTVVKLDKASRILSLDCDFLGLDPVSDDSAADFTKGRDPEKPDAMNRLYVIENRYTLTGGMADHRKPLAASQLEVAAAALAAEIGKITGDTALAAAAAALAGTADEALKAWIAPAAKDLAAVKGKAVVLAGSRTSEAVQALAAGINNALGAYGSVIQLLQATAAAPAAGSLADLTAAVKAGGVKAVFSFTAADLFFDAPGAEDLNKLFSEKKVVVIHHGLRSSKTQRASKWSIPAAHYLESWGDVTTNDGAYGIVQPMIAPLFDGASENEVYLALLGKKTLGPTVVAAAATPAAGAAPPVAAVAGSEDDPAYTAVRETFAKIAGSLDEQKWNFTLRDGFLKGSKGTAATAALNAAAVAALVGKAKPVAAPSKDALEVVLVPDSSIWDGRYINNAWLQEAPDPITKLTWDNAALIGSKTFRELGLKQGQMVEITTASGKLALPALEAPGHVSNSITIQLGYGQVGVGSVAQQAMVNFNTSEVGEEFAKCGFDAYGLRSSASEWVITGAKLAVQSTIYPLAITQEHNTMEGRAVYREGTTEEYKAEPNFAQVTGTDGHAPDPISLYGGQFGRKTTTNPDGFNYETKHQWGMTIDLSKCIGCTACLIACQSENNIAVVGKDQVIKGRVMQWIRMDRYFATPRLDELPASTDFTGEELENAEMVTQPMACQQCEAAPCETVCPVNATVHTEEGLNAMAYNRCIGTRYCANNCPYTARRFNWFDYNKRPLDELYKGPLSNPEKTGVREISKLQKNPNVTVRMRGVIEKCTYCVQRLESAKIVQMQSQRDSKDFRVAADGVKTACQQSCPTGAIEFGDLANKDSTINKTKASLRNYTVLKYLNTLPRTSYLARIRNVNADMPGAAGITAWSKLNS